MDGDRQISCVDLGLTSYGDVWALQKRMFDLRCTGEIGDMLLLNEHRHVYTLGKSGNENHLLASDVSLQDSHSEVFHIDRGGDVTYHGQGQIVGYPIIKLDDYYADLHRYLRDLEEVIIRVLADFNIMAGRDQGSTGVWVGSEKIAAIGVKVSRWVTMHGFALNVNTDLSYFDKIIPCGIFDKGVTSMQILLNREIMLTDVCKSLQRHFGDVFGVRVMNCSLDDIMSKVPGIMNERIEIV